MNIVIAILLGLLWGAAVALLGGFVTRRAFQKATNGAIMAGNLIRTLLDLGALGLVFLMRNCLPFDYTYMLIATAVSLSLGLIIISFRLAAKK